MTLNSLGFSFCLFLRIWFSALLAICVVVYKLELNDVVMHLHYSNNLLLNSCPSLSVHCRNMKELGTWPCLIQCWSGYLYTLTSPSLPRQNPNGPWAPRVVDKWSFQVIQSNLDYWCFDFVITITMCMYNASCRVHNYDIVANNAMMLDRSFFFWQCTMKKSQERFCLVWHNMLL